VTDSVTVAVTVTESVAVSIAAARCRLDGHVTLPAPSRSSFESSCLCVSA
jgi:hypothetical protein